MDMPINQVYKKFTMVDYELFRLDLYQFNVSKLQRGQKTKRILLIIILLTLAPKGGMYLLNYFIQRYPLILYYIADSPNIAYIISILIIGTIHRTLWKN